MGEARHDMCLCDVGRESPVASRKVRLRIAAVYLVAMAWFFTRAGATGVPNWHVPPAREAKVPIIEVFCGIGEGSCIGSAGG